jgi:glucose/arabinose dehydrogenase
LALVPDALAPDYNATGRVFVSYTDTSGDSQLVRYFRHPLNPAMLDPLTARTFLTVDQPYANHNGGLARFGPDGYLWFGLGDGGSAGDPHNHGQDPGTLLGALLRIDVSGEDYTIPPNNPFVGGGGRGEVWAYGLRNPWRFSFDRDTGDLYIADVGQNRWEEVNYEANGTGGGRNYGWSGYEGNEVFRSTRTAADAVFPVATYRLGDGNCSVTGGYAYRGQDVPGLRGVYLFADYCSGRLWGLWGENGTWRQELVKETGHRVAAFAQLSSGELLLLDHAGTAYRIAAPAAG